MIRVELAIKPANFDALVRNPGLSAIAELVGESPTVLRRGPRRPKIADRREDIPADKFPPLWTKAIPDMLRAYRRICAYLSCYIEPVTGMPTVDHMMPKSHNWNRVYEWENYRLACHLVNTRKNEISSILDPFEIRDDWFELEMVGFQIKPRVAFPQNLSASVENTLRILNKSDCCELRYYYAKNYWEFHIDYDFLLRRSPFIGMELRRQNRLRRGDV